MVNAAIAGLGRMHALVNCAGAMPGGPFFEVSRRTFDHTFAVNARAPKATMQAIAPHFVEHGGGAVVNIARANAVKNKSPEGPYNASKAALVALTKAVAHDSGVAGSARTASRRVRPRLPSPRGTATRTIQADPEHEYLRKSRVRRAGDRVTRRWPCCSWRRTTPPHRRGQRIIVDGGELGGGTGRPPRSPPIPDSTGA